MNIFLLFISLLSLVKCINVHDTIDNKISFTKSLYSKTLVIVDFSKKEIMTDDSKGEKLEILNSLNSFSVNQKMYGPLWINCKFCNLYGYYINDTENREINIYSNKYSSDFSLKKSFSNLCVELGTGYRLDTSYSYVRVLDNEYSKGSYKIYCRYFRPCIGCKLANRISFYFEVEFGVLCLEKILVSEVTISKEISNTLNKDLEEYKNYNVYTADDKSKSQCYSYASLKCQINIKEYSWIEIGYSDSFSEKQSNFLNKSILEVSVVWIS